MQGCKAKRYKDSFACSHPFPYGLEPTMLTEREAVDACAMKNEFGSV
jgi:hypothetical protein